MKTTIFMILLSVVLSLPYRYEGTYPLLKNITAMSVISKNQYDYGMP